MENNHSLCWEYSISRSFLTSQVLAYIPEGTILGPVLVVPKVKTLDGYGIEVAIPSNADPANTSYVVISRETRPAAKRERTWLGWSRSGARGAAMRDRSFHHGGSWARTISESKKFIVVLCVLVCVCGVCLCFLASAPLADVFVFLSLVAWQSTAALHVESMSNNSTAELQTDLRKDAVPCNQKVQHTSTCNTFRAPHHMSMMRWEGVLPRNCDSWEQWLNLTDKCTRGASENTTKRVRQLSEVLDGNQKQPTEQKTHQKHVEPSSLATDWPSQHVRWYTWKRCWPQGGK